MRFDLSETAYVEAHMMGMPASTPLRPRHLPELLTRIVTHMASVLVSSLKTNVGHTEPMSGLAAIIK